ncbi:MAG: hypothetical protein JW973_05805 [Bacteroidales bacterium]|nr:hypothetical protein [Bacteroidales bacterium]
MSHRFLLCLFKTGKIYLFIWQLLSLHAFAQITDTTHIVPSSTSRSDTMPFQIYTPETELPSDSAVDYLKIIDRTEDSGFYLPYKKANGRNLNHRTQAFYDSLKIKAEHKRFTRELYNALFRDVSRKVQTGEVLNLESYKFYEDRIIRSVTLKSLSVFGPTIEDTTIKTDNFFKKLGNKLHTQTRSGVIRRSLLFHEGDKLNPFLLFENERLLRDLPYIEDARFLITGSETRADSVDVLVLVKDVWPIGFGAELTDLQTGYSSLWHNNVVGLGHQIDARLFWNTGKKDMFGQSILYSVANIGGSYIEGDLYYADRWNLKTYRISLNRMFMATDINWAGAVNLEKTESTQNISLRNQNLEDQQLEYQNIDVWVGRSFALRSRMGIWPTETNLFMGGRYINVNYFKGPITHMDTFYRFQDKSQILVSLGLSRQGFYRSNLIYSFGRTEDVPFGYLIKFTGGIEQGQYKYRPYYGLSASGGFNIGRLGYFYALAEYGSFVYDNRMEQGTFHFLIKYFTDIQTLNRFQFRQFLTAEYLMGINRNADEFVSLENRGGIAGLNSLYLRGDEKKVLKLESVMFTPYMLLGFRFVFFAFADLGMIKGSYFHESNNKLYSGIGLGLRLRNERLVFNTFQLKFTWYTSLPEDPDYDYFVASGEPRLRMPNFFMDKPQIISY